ncbi:MAG: ASKHA domain-containing protein [Verrucomicrobiota bacterium]
MSTELHFNGRRTGVAPGSSLFDYAETLGINVPTSCRKNGKCKECVVEVTEGMECLSKPVPPEKHLRDNFRLSCCCKVISDSGVVRCHTMRRGEMRIERQAFQLPTGNEKWKLDPAVTRDGDRFGGSDVMSRIQYDTHDGSKLLQRTLAGYLTHAIEEFPVDPKTIYELIVAGNSTMRDIFFRLNVYSIGQSPYRSITELEMEEGKRTTTILSESAKKLLLPIHSEARVYGLPIISGHVGADAAACMLGVNLANEERLICVMDIGTNTELILGNKNKIFAASCPAGPAFEGGKISCGMPGLPGAIEKVKIADDGSIQAGVIGDVPAQGICGSGLVDLLSELLRTNRINHLGRFEQGENKFVLDVKSDSPVYFTESDINELAQAKGANVAGLHIIFDQYGIRYEDLDVFYLAGGFGRHLNVESSRRIGLIPNIYDSKILQVGNASIEGACIALLSRTKRVELENLVKKVTHCRLEAHPNFFNYFVDGCQFNPVEFSDALEIS